MEKKWTKTKIKKEAIEWVICFIIAYILYLLLNYFVGTVSGVKQVSMESTANEGEKLVIQRTKLGKRELHYGDIITFLAPKDSVRSTGKTTLVQGEGAIAKYDERKGFSTFAYSFLGINKKSFIKRVIGLPGDQIKITEDGKVYRNDELLDEPYLKDGTTNINGDYTNIIVPEDTVYVMGDNRLKSMDSRYFGAVPLNKIDGYVITRIWPLNKIGKLK